MTPRVEFPKSKSGRASLAVLMLFYFAVAVGIVYGMATTANTTPQAVCLTRPWLDVKPPC